MKHLLMLRKCTQLCHKKLATFSFAVPRQEILVLLGILQQMSRKIHGRVRMRDGSHVTNDILECVLLSKHVVQICPLTNNILYSFRVQIMQKPDSIGVAVSFHLEYEVRYVAETKATMPT